MDVICTLSSRLIWWKKKKDIAMVWFFVNTYCDIEKHVWWDR